MLAKISKLVGAVVGVVVAFAFMKIPFIANLGITPDALTGWLTTAIVTAITTYWSPKNAA